MGRKTVKNNITSPELLADINPQNVRLMNDFLMYLKSVNRAETTISTYKNDLEIFFVWCLQNANNKFFTNVTKRDIVAYQNYLLYTNKNSPARVRRLKASLSSLSNYIENILDDEPEFKDFRNIINKIENPINQPTREKSIFTPEELQSLLDYLIENKEYQKACIVALAMYSGRRKSELIRFKVSYFDKSNIIYGSLYKTPEKVKTKGRGDGKYLSLYVLSNKFKPYLDLWLNQRKELGINSEWLFVTKDVENDDYRQIGIGGITHWTKQFSEYLNKPFYFHSLRHFFTTELSKAKLPSNVIQGIVGWDSADMVNIYNDLTTDDELGNYFDENGIKSVSQSSLSEL